MNNGVIARTIREKTVCCKEQCKMKIRNFLSLAVALCLFAAAAPSVCDGDSFTAVSWGDSSAVSHDAAENSSAEIEGTDSHPDETQNECIDQGRAFELHKQMHLSFEDKDRGYEETQLRRFEIIFFISLPASLFFSFAGAAAFKAATAGEISFSSLDYSYILLSSVGISFTIAFRDNRVVYRKKAGKQEQQQ